MTAAGCGHLESIAPAEPPGRYALHDPTVTTPCPLNLTLPSVRLAQQWIRQQQPIVLVLHHGLQLHGRLLWQDSAVLALQQHGNEEPVLVQRLAVSLIHAASTVVATDSGGQSVGR